MVCFSEGSVCAYGLSSRRDLHMFFLNSRLKFGGTGKGKWRGNGGELMENAVIHECNPDLISPDAADGREHLPLLEMCRSK